MNIWIMRHGEATFNAPSDKARSLTETGIKTAKLQGQWLAQYLRSQNQNLDKIIVSPYIRAKQTLENLLSGMQAVKFDQNFANLIEEWEEITPNGNPDTVENYLHFLHNEGAKQILLISHLPLVSDLVQILTQYQAHASFPTATIAEIEWAKNSGKLLQVKSP